MIHYGTHSQGTFGETRNCRSACDGYLYSSYRIPLRRRELPCGLAQEPVRSAHHAITPTHHSKSGSLLSTRQRRRTVLSGSLTWGAENVARSELLSRDSIQNHGSRLIGLVSKSSNVLFGQYLCIYVPQSSDQRCNMTLLCFFDIGCKWPVPDVISGYSRCDFSNDQSSHTWWICLFDAPRRCAGEVGFHISIRNFDIPLLIPLTPFLSFQVLPFLRLMNSYLESSICFGTKSGTLHRLSSFYFALTLTVSSFHIDPRENIREKK